MNSKVTPLILGENPLVGTLDEEVKKVKRDFKNFDKTGQPSETWKGQQRETDYS